jgi:hypothetical protein
VNDRQAPASSVQPTAFAVEELWQAQRDVEAAEEAERKACFALGGAQQRYREIAGNPDRFGLSNTARGPHVRVVAILGRTYSLFVNNNGYVVVDECPVERLS